MTRTRRIGLFWLILSSGISVWWGFAMGQMPNGSVDFRAVYYGTRCLLENRNPYSVNELESVYQAEGGKRPSETFAAHQTVTLYVNVPTTFLFVTPFATLPYGSARQLWMILSVGTFILAAFLIWSSTANLVPVLSGGLICFILANSEVLFGTGNAAGIAVGLCALAVWCFLEEKFVWAGVLCLAVSLAIKPHDAGFVWLYFLLAGGASRRRALETLLITAVVGVSAFLWVEPVAPQWIAELHSNILVGQLPGGINDPSPTSVTGVTPGMVIDLQSAISIFRDDARFYNPVSYLVCGSLLLVWSVRTLRARFSRANAWLALAAVVPLTLLVTYHRPYDAKLLLLAVPACAMLWAEDRPIRWAALLLTTAGIVSTSDIPLTILLMLTKDLHISTAALSGKIVTVLMRPTPLILLAMGIFYLWVYLRRDPDGVVTQGCVAPRKTLLASPIA